MLDGSGWMMVRRGGDSLSYGGERGQGRGLVRGLRFWRNVGLQGSYKRERYRSNKRTGMRRLVVC